jgi:hypothetical protein
MSRSALLLIFSQSRGILPLYFSMCLLKWATYPMETTTLVQTMETFITVIGSSSDGYR